MTGATAQLQKGRNGTIKAFLIASLEATHSSSFRALHGSGERTEGKQCTREQGGNEASKQVQYSGNLLGRGASMVVQSGGSGKCAERSLSSFCFPGPIPKGNGSNFHASRAHS